MQGVFFRHRIIVSPNVHLSDRNRRREVKIMVKEPEFEFVVELDDNDLEHEVGGTSIPCGTIIIASLTQCFGDTVIWGSCRLGTRACC